MAKILKTDQNNPDPADLETGAEIIRKGGLVVFPTETVYGLGANAFSEESCRKIYKAKNRPADNPLIVHISSLEMLGQVASEVDEKISRILMELWPGPVTLLFPKNDRIPDIVTGGSNLVAVRMPDNPLALGLIERSGVPIAAPSANVSTRPSITDSLHAIEELSEKVDLIYDSGETSHGLESTIIDLSGNKPILLRSGSKPVEELTEIFGHIDVTDFARGLQESTIPLAPGMKYRHYSPRKKLFLASSREVIVEVCNTAKLKGKIAAIATDEICAKSRINCLSLGPEEALDEIGRNLFSTLRKLEKIEDESGIIMPFPEYKMGLTIMNRIRKASSGNVDSLGELEKLIFK